MRRLLLGLLLCLGVFIVQLRAEDRIQLRVIYCGNPGSAREVDFQSFLQQHFTSVEVVDGSAFKDEQADKADVVIFDWTDHHKNGGGIDFEKYHRMRELPVPSAQYMRPTILIGARGGTIADKLKLKINWLCLCLDGPAHHLALNHSVFHTPLEVNPEFEEIPTRDGYPDITIDKSLGPTMKVWRVQNKDYPEIDPGLVSDLYGFADSPDAEVIAQGIAEKGPDTLALGRQANFFLWGFSAPPSDMTPSAQRLFVNVIVYMRQFDGQVPLVHKASIESRSREWALRYALIPRGLTKESLAKEEKTQREALQNLVKNNLEALPKEARDDPQAYIEKRVEQMKQVVVGEFEWLLPEELRQQFGMDANKYLAYYTENLEYVRLEDDDGSSRLRRFLVDEDVKSLGLSNRHVDLLDKCVSMLEQDDNSELALRLLKRYTQEDFVTANKWRAWLNENHSHLFFSDVGGFKFFVAPAK
jgi:hypothetical protein